MPWHRSPLRLRRRMWRKWSSRFREAFLPVGFMAATTRCLCQPRAVLSVACDSERWSPCAMTAWSWIWWRASNVAMECRLIVENQWMIPKEAASTRSLCEGYRSPNLCHRGTSISRLASAMWILQALRQAKPFGKQTTRNSPPVCESRLHRPSHGGSSRSIFTSQPQSANRCVCGPRSPRELSARSCRQRLLPRPRGIR